VRLLVLVRVLVPVPVIWTSMRVFKDRRPICLTPATDVRSRMTTPKWIDTRSMEEVVMTAVVVVAVVVVLTVNGPGTTYLAPAVVREVKRRGGGLLI